MQEWAGHSRFSTTADIYTLVLAGNKNRLAQSIDSALLHRAGLEALGMEVNMPEELLRAALDPVQNVERRNIIGGPSPARVAEMIRLDGQRLEELTDAWKQRREKLTRASDQLEALVDAMVAEE